MRSWGGQRMCSSSSRNGGRVLRWSGHDIASNDAEGYRDGDACLPSRERPAQRTRTGAANWITNPG